MPNNQDPSRRNPRSKVVLHHLTRMVDDFDEQGKADILKAIDVISNSEFIERRGGPRRCPFCGRPEPNK